MISNVQQIWPLALFITGISGDIIMNQSPAVLFVRLGQTATINCTASQDVNDDVNWYQQREGQKPSLLISDANYRYTGVPERFIGSQLGISFTLTISNVQEEDVADYYCMQDYSVPQALSFGKGTKIQLSRERSQPKLILLPPSLEQVKAKSAATLMCLVNHFYPAELKVQWKKNGAIISDGVQTSNYLRASDSTYSLSSLLILSRSDWESNVRFSCDVTHVTLSSPLSRSIRRSECV